MATTIKALPFAPILRKLLLAIIIFVFSVLAFMNLELGSLDSILLAFPSDCVKLR